MGIFLMGIAHTETPMEITQMLLSSDVRLQFAMPEFVRLIWASEEAKLVWSQEFPRLSELYLQLEKRAVINGIKPALICSVNPSDFPTEMQFWGDHGLSLIPLSRSVNRSYSAAVQQPGPNDDWVYRAVVGDSSIAWKIARSRDDKEIGRLLGYPDCCINFFNETWVKAKMIDPTPAMAGEVIPHPGNNILLRWLGLRLVSHLPCSHDCKATTEIAEGMVTLARAEYLTDIDKLLEVLSWPVQYSSLHGIAEIVTPVFKIITNTEPLRHKFVRQFAGKEPVIRARGNEFPFEQLDTWTANGFKSPATMQRAHQAILDLIEPVSLDSVIDFGCGNGELLRKIKQRYGSFIYGVDSDGTKKPDFVGDIFEFTLDRHYDLALISWNRFKENPYLFDCLLRQIKNYCKALVIYSYENETPEYKIPVQNATIRDGQTVATLYKFR
jgi:hypothetical protein